MPTSHQSSCHSHPSKHTHPEQPTILQVAVCLFPHVTALDHQGPLEMLGFLSPNPPYPIPAIPKFFLEFTYLGPTLDPITPASGPRILPDVTYDSIVQSGRTFDIILVPGGPGADPSVAPPSIFTFIRSQLPSIRANPNGYLLSVCTGAWIYATLGILDGKRATTNKAGFKKIKAATSDKIDWIAKARWVEEDERHLWTSSGVTAGTDMAAAFFEYLVGAELAAAVRGMIELRVRAEDDDEFAALYGDT